MKRKLILAAALVLGVAAGARAQESKEASEFFHQTPGGQSELSIHGGYRMGTSRTTTAGAVDTKLTGLDRLGLGYEYGLTDMMSLGADVSWSSFKIDTTPEVKSDSIEPVLLQFQGKYPIGFGFFEYGANGTFALEQAKINSGGDTNRTFGDILTGEPRGGFHLSPWVGVSAAAGPGTAGASIGSEVVSTDSKVDVAGTEVTYKGGNRTKISAFYEYMLSDMPLGASLSWINQSEIKSVTAGVESTPTKALSLTQLDLYMRIPQGDSAWIPSLAYAMKASSDQYDKLDDLHLNLAYRMGL